LKTFPNPTNKARPTVVPAADSKRFTDAEASRFARFAFGRTMDKMITTRMRFVVVRMASSALHKRGTIILNVERLTLSLLRKPGRHFQMKCETSLVRFGYDNARIALRGCNAWAEHGKDRREADTVHFFFIAAQAALKSQ
jgi:hypothetical protein